MTGLRDCSRSSTSSRSRKPGEESILRRPCKYRISASPPCSTAISRLSAAAISCVKRISPQVISYGFDHPKNQASVRLTTVIQCMQSSIRTTQRSSGHLFSLQLLSWKYRNGIQLSCFPEEQE